MTFFISMSSRADFVSVVDLVKSKNCEIELTRPLVIMKKQMAATSNSIEFRANFLNRESNTVIPKGTLIKVKRANRVGIYFEDIFLHRLCVIEGNLCADLDRMTKLDLEYQSNNGLKLNCKGKK